MATVYLAQDLKHDRRVAVKVLHPSLAAALGHERFLREIRIAAALNHPHILPLHDSGEADGFLYYVMPFVAGESLRDRLNREGQLAVGDAVQIACEVADGLAYAHAHAVVHRDVKPENILLSEGHALIADFGVARALDVAGPRLTETGFAVGTPQYMSPEQSLAEPVDGRSDVYALGCVLYEMLAGEPPFTGANSQALLARKLHHPATPLPLIRDTVSSSLAQTIHRALARSPADRFATTREFATALTSGSGVPAQSAALPAPVVARRRPRIAIAVAVAVVALVAAWAGRALTRSHRATGAATIAVLPFDNLGQPDKDFFAAGMTEEITARLGSVSGLGLVPRRATQARVGPDRTLRDIGKDLGTDYLLIGSVRWGDTTGGPPPVRITLQLVRAQDERQLWATTYDRTLDDIFDVQSEIASAVIERLGLALGAGERRRLAEQPTANHEAYTLYLKGRYFWNKRTEADIQTALDYFRRAVDLDPSYALAWVGVADVWIFRGFYSRLAPDESFPKAKAAAMRALEFDSTLAEAHASLAHIHFEYDHDWAEAEREYRRALELNPSYAVGHHWYGGFLSGMARHDEALRQAEIARSLDPLSRIVQTWLGLRHYFAHRYDQAITEYLKALELEGGFAPAHWHLGWAYAAVGRTSDAVAEAELALALDSTNLVYLASVGHAYALAGRARDARATLTRLAAAARTRHVSAYHVAAIHVALGDTSAGLDWLDRALAEQSPWIGYMAVDPRLDPLRSLPRFQAMLRKAKLT